jgi:hypothetical protein
MPGFLSPASEEVTMLLFIPRSLCALKRVAAKAEHYRFAATQGIRIASASGLFRAEATDGHRAIIVQGLASTEEPPWPGFKELPDDTCEAIILPKDLERGCKVGDASLQSRFNVVGIATRDSEVSLGLGTDVVTARTVEGRFPNISQVIPKKRPLFTFRVDPKTLAETLLAIADLLPEEARGVQCFYYGEELPLGFCARNSDSGLMIDALVVPLVAPKPEDKVPEDRVTDNKPEEGENPKPNGRRRKKAEPAPEANEQAVEPTPTAEEQTPTGQDAKPNDTSGRNARKSKAKAS